MLSKFATAVVVLLIGANAACADVTPPAPPVTTCSTESSDNLRYKQLLFDAQNKTYASDDAKKKAVDQATSMAAAASDSLAQCRSPKAGGTCDTINQDYYNVAKDLRETCAIEDCNSFAQCGPDDKAGINPSSKSAVSDAKSTCSALASSDLSKLQDQLDKDRDHLDTLKDKAADAQKDMGSANKDAVKDINDLRKQMTDAQKESAQKISDIQKQALSDQKDLNQAIAQIQNHIDELTDNLNQQVIAQQTAHDNMENQKVAAKINCQQQASQQVTQLQGQVLGQMKAGSYNRGSLIQLAQNAGISDRQSWQRVSNKYYRYCIASMATLESFAAANRAYSTSVLTVKKTDDSINQKLRTAQGQILQKDNGQACGGMGPQTEKCMNAAQTQQQIAQESQNLQTTQAGLAQSAALSQQQAAQDAGQKMMAAQGAQSAYDDEKKRTGNLQKLIDAKLAAGGSTDVDAKKLNESFNKFKFKKELAQQVLDCDKKNNSSKCDKDQCPNAQSFITSTKNAVNPNRSDSGSSASFSSGSDGGRTPSSDNLSTSGSGSAARDGDGN